MERVSEGSGAVCVLKRPLRSRFVDGFADGFVDGFGVATVGDMGGVEVEREVTEGGCWGGFGPCDAASRGDLGSAREPLPAALDACEWRL